MKFKTGDKVWAVCDNRDYRIHGTLAGLVVEPTIPDDCILKVYPRTNQWYQVELLDHPHPRTMYWLAREEHLSPRDEDGREVGRWYESIFKPKDLVRFNFWKTVKKLYEEEKL